MRIPKTCGSKPKGKACDGFPCDGTLAEIDRQAVKSLKGEGKNKLTPSYGTLEWNRGNRGRRS